MVALTITGPMAHSNKMKSSVPPMARSIPVIKIEADDVVLEKKDAADEEDAEYEGSYEYAGAHCKFQVRQSSHCMVVLALTD